MDYDLAIIGSGGGASAAIAARRAGRRVVMVERGTVGGTCVNTGCVPSKALLAAAEARHVAAAQRFPGISVSASQTDLGVLLDATGELVAGMRTDKYLDLAAAYGWEILQGTARFVPGPALAVTLRDGATRLVHAAHYLVATGSAPWAPPVDGLAESGYLTSTTALELERLPASLLVLGGSAVGLELGQMFARLGTRVTIVEALPRLAPAEEPEISQALQQALAAEGIGVRTAATLAHVSRDQEGIVATIRRHDDGALLQEQTEQLLVASGRRPVTEDLDLEAVGVQLGDHGQVLVDEQLRTSNPRIWAAGDITGHPQYVYVAAAQGALVAANAFESAGQTIDYRHLPRVTFTSPAIAAVGLTDQQAHQRGLACECRVLPLAQVPRAIVDRDTRGLVKLVAERGTGRLLGAHLLAQGAGDVIAAATYALAAGMTVDQLANTWSPFLTMAESLKLAAQSFTRDVAKLSCCAA
jgi:mercuric reductase